MNTYVKIRFTSRYGQTAGLVIPVDAPGKNTIAEISRKFPASECMKMGILEVSREYPTWELAFEDDFTNLGSRTCVNPHLV